MIDVLLKGSRHEIWYITEGGHTTFKDLLDEVKATGALAAKLREEPRVSNKKLHPKAWKKLLGAMQRTVRHGKDQVSKTNAIKRWSEPCYDAYQKADSQVALHEFRPDFIRVLFFEEEPVPVAGPSRLIITHAFKKKRDDTPDEEKTRFVRLRNAYYTWRRSQRSRR